LGLGAEGKHHPAAAMAGGGIGGDHHNRTGLAVAEAAVAGPEVEPAPRSAI
jgi:hypothetical protein